MMPSTWLWIGLGSLAAGALFSTLQHSARSASRSVLEGMAQNADEGVARRLRRIANDVEGHAASAALPRVFCNLLVVVAVVFWLQGDPGLADASGPAVLPTVLAVAVSSLLIWLVSFVVPAAIASNSAEAVVSLGSRPIRLLYIALSPMRPVLAFFNEVIRRLAGENARSSMTVDAELLSAVEESEREGRLDETERDMIEAVVEFKTTTVEQIMTPRTDVSAIEYSDDLLRVQREIEAIGHSRIPVYEKDLDHILGVLYAKDLLRHMIAENGNAAEAFVLQDILRPATFVPEAKTVRELLTELLAAKVHIAIIADEYGGTSGLVTIEDIVEEIFGEIRDEYESEEEGPKPIVLHKTMRSAEIDARVEIDDANDELEAIELDLPEHDDYDTVGGFVIVTLGRIPDAGESFEHEGVRVTILEAEPTRVLRIRLEAIEIAANVETDAVDEA